MSGDLTVDGSDQKGLLTVTTVSGDATRVPRGRRSERHTVSGDFLLGLGAVDRSRLRTTSGDLTLAAFLAGDGRLDVETISGDVRIDLANAAQRRSSTCRASAATSATASARRPARTDEYGPGKELRFTRGQGPARVRVKTLNGDVSVCNL